MSEKMPVKVVGKRMTQDQILYQIRWSDQSVTYEPFSSLSNDVMLLVHKYEYDIYRNDSTSNDVEPPKAKKLKPDPQPAPELILSDSPPPPSTPKPSSDRLLDIILLRKQTLTHEVQFLVKFLKTGREQWLPKDQLKKLGPQYLCDFLLDRVEWVSMTQID